MGAGVEGEVERFGMYEEEDEVGRERVGDEGRAWCVDNGGGGTATATAMSTAKGWRRASWSGKNARRVAQWVHHGEVRAHNGRPFIFWHHHDVADGDD